MQVLTTFCDGPNWEASFLAEIPFNWKTEMMLRTDFNSMEALGMETKRTKKASRKNSNFKIMILLKTQIQDKVLYEIIQDN